MRVYTQQAHAYDQTHSHTRALSLSHTQTLDFFREQQRKVVAFASGLHGRLGALSRVSWLNDQTLVMIADEVSGQWSLIKKWQESKDAGHGKVPHAE